MGASRTRLPFFSDFVPRKPRSTSLTPMAARKAADLQAAYPSTQESKRGEERNNSTATVRLGEEHLLGRDAGRAAAA